MHLPIDETMFTIGHSTPTLKSVACIASVRRVQPTSAHTDAESSTMRHAK